MRRIAVEQQRWLMKGLWCLPTVIFMAVVAGFWQTQAQNTLSESIPVCTRWGDHRHVLGQWRYLWVRVQRDGKLG